MSLLHALYRRLHEGGPGEAEHAARELGEAARREGRRVIVVSACLLGEKTRYDGGDKRLPAATDPLLADPSVVVLPLCPEILGGMGCPRPPVHFDAEGRIVDDAGTDHGEAMRRGAERADALARLAGAVRALLKERSPSCGVHEVHGPEGIAKGHGLFAGRLRARHLPVLSEEDVVKSG